MKTQLKKNQPKGFTFIELLVVITVASVLGAIFCAAYKDLHPSKGINDIRTAESEIGSRESRVLWDHRQKIPAGWHIVHSPTMKAYVRERFEKDADRVWIMSPTEVSTFKDHPDAIVHVDVRNIIVPEDKAIVVYMMSADGERVSQRYGVGLTGPTLIERDSEK